MAEPTLTLVKQECRKKGDTNYGNIKTRERPFFHINRLSVVTCKMRYNEHQLRISSVPRGELGTVPQILT
jgi:hypothetical protein